MLTIGVSGKKGKEKTSQNYFDKMTKKTKIGLIQLKISKNVELNIKNSISKIKVASNKGAKIICVPELFLSKYFCQTEKHSNFKLAEKRKSRTRVGRGNGSKGTYSGRGLKGQKSRSGGGVPLFFEGGQLPLVKRLPFLRGFKNRFKKDFSIVNISDLESRFKDGDEVNSESLFKVNLIRKSDANVKILGNSTLGFLGCTILNFFFGSIYLFANKVSPANDLCSNLTNGL